MTAQIAGNRRRGLRAVLLFAVIAVVGGGLVVWKSLTGQGGAHAAGVMAEPVEVVTAATASARLHRGAATAIGTVLAMRSITLRNELPGTVRWVGLRPGRMVEAGPVLVAQDGKVLVNKSWGIPPQARYMPTTTVPQFDVGAMSAVFTSLCSQLPDQPAGRANPQQFR